MMRKLRPRTNDSGPSSGRVWTQPHLRRLVKALPFCVQSQETMDVVRSERTDLSERHTFQAVVY